MTRAAKSNEGARRRPRTGERRKCRKPLWIDRLPAEVKNSIIASRAEGKTWEEIARVASAIAYKRIPKETARRWYDLRIDQPQHDASAISPLLREIIDLLKSRLPAVSQ